MDARAGSGNGVPYRDGLGEMRPWSPRSVLSPQQMAIVYQDDSPMSQSSTTSVKRDCACDSCWLARRACDKYDPCSRCCQRGITCIFSGRGVRSKIASRRAQPRPKQKQTMSPEEYYKFGTARLTGIFNDNQINADTATSDCTVHGSENRIAEYISESKMLLPDDVHIQTCSCLEC